MRHLGGRDAAGTYLNKVVVYNPTTNTWTAKPNLSAARASLGAATLFSTIHAFGGRNSASILPTTEAYHP